MVASGHNGAHLARRFDRTAFAFGGDRHDREGRRYGDIRGSWNAGCGAALQPTLRFAAGRCVGGAQLVGFIRLLGVIVIVVVVIAVVVIVVVVIVVVVIVIVFILFFFRRVVVRYVVGIGDVLFVNLAASPTMYPSTEPRRLVLRNFQSPGDIVMLTAAVRDLHQAYPGAFLTDVRTPCPALWENNPYISSIADDDERAEQIECHYPLIHTSNQLPHHFVQGFTAFLADSLQVPIKTTAFKGDIHLSAREKTWISQVHEIVGSNVPFWIVVAGGKRDFTIKWWDHDRFQAVVDHFRGRILFVQAGEAGHHHPPLRGAINLVGATNLRQLVRLIYHAQGVLCPVTLHMHLAAAIEVKGRFPKNRPCVVVAGGREPPQWEAYPHHQFIHTIGALPCCDNGGCWKSRTVALGDGDPNDKPQSRCVSPVGDLPRCMDMISPEEVIARIERYFSGGAVRYLTETEAAAAEAAIRSSSLPELVHSHAR